MTIPLRSTLLVSIGLGSILALALGREARGAATPLPAAEPLTALTHEVFRFDETDEQASYQLAREACAHEREAHPSSQLTAYMLWGEPRGEVHYISEAINTLASFVRVEASPDCPTCQEHQAQKGAPSERTRRSRLIGSDPAKEEELGPQAALIVRSMRAHYLKVGEASDAARSLTEYMNTTYPEVFVRAYDEWHPRSGRIQLHIHYNWVPDWELVEARMRADPVVRRLMSGSADLFVEDSIEDAWLVRLGQ